MEDLTGKQFGPYQIVAPLGEGGMAAVYKAYQPAMERYVALKVLPRHFSDDPEFTARFQREAKILAQLQHPYILPVFDSGQADGYAYIVMPFVQSGTLTDLLKGQPLLLPFIGRIITQIGEALDYAHARGLIHRDIKPSNVLMDESGNCLLADFGLARIADASINLTASGAIMGTPAYMSPEQGSGQEVDTRSDIYALGIILYELVTGRVPYKAETPVAVIFKHIQDPLPSARKLNPELPEALELVILKALSKNPEDRYQTAADMIKAVQTAIADLPPAEILKPEKRESELQAFKSQVEKATRVKKRVDASASKAIPIWRRAWIYWALGGVLIMVLGVFFGPQLWNAVSPLVSGVFSTEKTDITVGSLQDFINTYPPTFEDDFSTQKSVWMIDDDIHLAMAPSQLKISVYDDKDVAIRRDHLSASDFLIQYDFMIEGNSKTAAQFEIRDSSFLFEINRGGEWLISIGNQNSGYGMAKKYYPGWWNNLTILVLDNKSWIYLNGELLASPINNVPGKTNALRADGSGTVFFDNLRFWNLDGFDITFEAHLSNSLDVPGYITGSLETNDINPMHYVYYQDQGVSWFEARDFCADMGGYLATIGSKEEDELVFNLTGKNGDIWLGATDEAEEGNWVWITGEPWTYSHWGAGQPDNYTGDDPNGENYLGMGTYESGTSLWNDGWAEALTAFVCEWDSIAPIYSIFDMLAEREPDFQTGFDSWSWEFVNPAENANADNGILVLSGDGSFVQLPNPDFQSDSFAVQFDFRISQNSLEDVGCGFLASLQGNDGTDKALWAGFSFGNAMHLQHLAPPDFEDLAIGDTFDVSGFNTFTLVVVGDEIAGFINGEVAYTANNPDGRVVFTQQEFQGGGDGDCEFDNYKIWDLSKVGFSDGSSIDSETIMTYISQQPPTFDDEFSTPNIAWGNTSNDLEIASLVENGTFTIPDQSESGISFPINELLNASNFVLEVEFDLPMMVSGESNKVAVQFRAYEMLLDSYNGTWIFYRNQGERSPIDWEADAFAPKSEKNLILLICYENYFVAYMNGELLYENNEIILSGLENRIVVYGDNFDHSFVKFDKIRFWNLDGVNISQ